jgi:hypothetical protein
LEFGTRCARPTARTQRLNPVWFSFVSFVPFVVAPQGAMQFATDLEFGMILNLAWQRACGVYGWKARPSWII